MESLSPFNVVNDTVFTDVDLVKQVSYDCGHWDWLRGQGVELDKEGLEILEGKFAFSVELDLVKIVICYVVKGIFRR